MNNNELEVMRNAILELREQLMNEDLDLIDFVECAIKVEKAWGAMESLQSEVME